MFRSASPSAIGTPKRNNIKVKDRSSDNPRFSSQLTSGLTSCFSISRYFEKAFVESTSKCLKMKYVAKDATKVKTNRMSNIPMNYSELVFKVVVKILPKVSLCPVIILEVKP